MTSARRAAGTHLATASTAFRDKVVVVTGASGGIGRAVVARFAREGARTVSVARTPQRLGAARRELAERGLTTRTVAVDCANYDAVTAAFAAIEAEHGHVDVLVNNVGQSARQHQTLFTESDPAVWDFLIDTNLRTTFNWSRVVAPGMRARRAGKIVNVSSEAAVYGDAKLVDYAATKGGVISFTRGLARELAPYGINVNAVSPGVTRTRAVTDGVPQDVVDAAMAQIPRGRMCEPEEIAAVIRFLASDDSLGVVGQNIVVSGGRTMH